MKVLSIDIETSPNKAWVWGFFDQNVGLNQVIEQTRMLCFAAKFLDERKVHFASEHHDNPYVVPSTVTLEQATLRTMRHQSMVEYAWDLLDEADVVMHFNGTSFDVKHLNREFLQAGLGPPSSYQQIDLLRIVRSSFKFPSNKLQNIADQLGLDGKVSHEGFDLWTKCMAGNESAWRKMRTYNKRDVTLLEELYAELRPWIKSHPNMNLHNKLNACPTCGSDNLERRGFYRTNVSEFQQYRCRECGSWCRDGKRYAGADRRSI